jgi:hypothetical protein
MWIDIWQGTDMPEVQLGFGTRFHGSTNNEG